MDERNRLKRFDFSLQSLNAPHDRDGGPSHFPNPPSAVGLLCKNRAIHPPPPCNPRAKVGSTDASGGEKLEPGEPGLQLSCQVAGPDLMGYAIPMPIAPDIGKLDRLDEERPEPGEPDTWHGSCKKSYLSLITAHPGRLMTTSSLPDEPDEALEEKRPAISPACLDAPN